MNVYTPKAIPDKPRGPYKLSLYEPVEDRSNRSKDEAVRKAT